MSEGDGEGGYLVPSKFTTWENKPGIVPWCWRRSGSVLYRIAEVLLLWGNRMIHRGQVEVEVKIDLQKMIEKLRDQKVIK
jgi:hypothetical protein